MVRLFPLACVVCAGCSFSIHFGADANSGDDAGPQDNDGAMDQVPMPWLTGWMYRKQITLHAAQIEAPNSGALANFPVMLALADADIAAHALADRSDVVFTAADATDRLDHEIETTDGSALTAWVKIPTLDAVTDTTIYVYYGNPVPPAALSPQNVWTASFSAVYHLQQDPGPGLPDQIRDATSNAHHGTADGSLNTPDSKPSLVGRAIDFNGNNSCISVPSFDVGNAFTISVWMNMANVNQIRTLLANSDDGSPTDGFRFFVNTNGGNDRKVWFETGNGSGGTASAITPVNAVASLTWKHVAAIVDRAASTATIVVDGVIANPASQVIRNDFSTMQRLEIARMQPNNGFDGMLDEMEIASTARSIEWLQTAFRNQGAPNAFYTVDDEQAAP